MSRVRRVLMTGFWSLALQFVGAATQLVTVPFFLKAWSEGVYNDWLALSALVGVLQYADGGMQQHVINLLTQKATQQRWAEFRADLASATLMYLLAVAVALAGTAGMCGWLSLSGHFDGRPLGHQAVGIAALLGVQVAARLVTGLVGGLYRAFGRADLTTFVAFILQSAMLASTLTVLLRGRGALSLAALQLAILVGLATYVFFDTRRRFPQSALTLRGARLGPAFRLLGPSLMFLFVSIYPGLTQQGTLLVIDAMMPAALVQFSTTRTVAGVVKQIIALFMNSAWPELTRIDAEGNREKFALAHRVLVKVTSLAAVPIAVALLFSGVELYAVWTRGRAQTDPLLMRLLLLDVLATVPWQCSSYVLAATSRIHGLSFVYLFAGIAHLILSIVAVHFFGVWSIGVVMLTLTIFVFGTVVPRWALEVVGDSWRSYVTGIYAPYAVLVAGTALVTWRTDRWLFPALSSSTGERMLAALSVGRFGVSELLAIARGIGDGVAALLCAAVLAWWVLLRGPEREFLQSAFGGILKRRRASRAAGVPAAS